MDSQQQQVDEDRELNVLLSLSRSVYNSDVEIEARLVHLVRKHVLRSSHDGDSSAGWNVLNRRCDICGGLQSGAQELVTHRYNAHTGSTSHHIYTCLICHYTFTRKDILRSHITTKHHPFDRNYTSTQQPDLNYNTCNVCSKRFVTKQGLLVHTRIHTGEKPYDCDVCHKCFAHHTSLTLHKRKHAGEKPYECDVCHKQFSQSCNLTEHKKIHTGEKPYECNVCQKRFSVASRLKIHNRIHTGEKPFKCDVCHKRFTQRTNRNVHKKMHTQKTI